MKKLTKKIDLLIIDVDDTFIYHRTVGIANKLFVQALFRLFRIRKPVKKFYTTSQAVNEIIKNLFSAKRSRKFDKKQIKTLSLLASTALSLHLLNIAKTIKNKIGIKTTSESMIKRWGDAVIRLRIPAEDYVIPRDIIKTRLNKKIMPIYFNLRRSNPGMKVVALSQHFNAEKDPIISILRLTASESNRFNQKQGVIRSYDLNIRDGFDKKAIAKKYISKYNSKSIALIVQDYDDVELLSLPNIKFVAYTKKLSRYIGGKNGRIAANYEKSCFEKAC